LWVFRFFEAEVRFNSQVSASISAFSSLQLEEVSMQNKNDFSEFKENYDSIESFINQTLFIGSKVIEIHPTTVSRLLH
jgi:hypothetical protein